MLIPSQVLQGFLQPTSAVTGSKHAHLTCTFLHCGKAPACLGKTHTDNGENKPARDRKTSASLCYMAAVLTLLCVLVQNINHLAKCTFNPALVVLTMTKTCALATSHMHKPNKTIFTVYYLKCWPLYYYVCVCVIEREFGNRNVWSHFDQFDLFPCHGCSERGRKRERKDRQKEKKKALNQNRSDVSIPPFARISKMEL